MGCSSIRKKYDYMSEPDYQKKTKLTQSILSGSEVLSESDIQKILISKVSFPKKISLAVVRLFDSEEGMDFQTINNEIVDQFYNKALWGVRVNTVISMPQVMVSKPVTLSSLRQAAVLLQADALVIIKPASFSDWKFQWFEENKAKGITSLEVLLLDTRTRVVPYTSLITETIEISKDKSDYNENELIARAKKASESKALLQVAPAISKFISTAM